MLRSLYNWTMAKAVHPHAEWWLALIAFVEASFFPIPPHPLLGLMCLAEPRKAMRFAVICTLGSVAGGMFGYAIGYFVYDLVGAQLISWLGLAEEFPVAACYLREYDVEAIIIAGATPVPFKLLTITAGFIGMSLIPFILASIAGRGLIFLSVGVLFRVFGRPIKAFTDRYLGFVTAGFVLVVVGGFLALAMLGGSSEKTAEKCETATVAELSAKPAA